MSPTETKDLRVEIQALIDESRYAEAHARLNELWTRDAKTTVANFVLSSYERMRDKLPAIKCRIGFLRSITIEPLLPLLRATAQVRGIDLSVYLGGFNSYAQEILDPASSLYAFKPDVVVLAVQTRDIAPELWEQYADLSREDIQKSIERVRESFSGWVRTFRSRSNASLVVHLLEKPLASEGILEAQGEGGQLTAIEKINAGLRQVCSEHRGVYALDYDALVARHGRARWFDENKWLTMRMPFATDSMTSMVSEWMKFIHPLTGALCKVLAVDLDNTLWGGVLGEEGIEGIQLGSEYPGAFYRSLQRAILDIHQRGVLLAVCSKNNRDEAMAALQNHSEMLLRPEHFAALRINWQDKAQNIREIAADLNLGTDAIAFLDDNPAERARVQSAMPEVKVIPVPSQPQGFAAALRDFPWFERLTLSAEDREHTRMYHEQQRRMELSGKAGSLEDFYRSLAQEVVISPVAPDTLVRVAQLTQKTNQYNVTTRRYSERQIEEITARPDWKVYCVRVKDQFGDNGIVGVLITRTEDAVCEIDTFLLSCRVIGRTVETAILGFLASESKNQGASRLQGWFIPTKKNAPVRDLYSSHGFTTIRAEENSTLWSLTLAEKDIRCPEWINLRATLAPHPAEAARA